MNKSTCFGSCVLLVALLGFAQASPGQEAGDVPLVHHQGSVAFVTGGVGRDSRQAMMGIAGGYNLKMIFALKGTGALLADVAVVVRDAAGATVLDTVSDGPCLFASVPRGRYRVRVVASGHALERHARVGATGAHMYFYWQPGALGEASTVSPEQREERHAASRASATGRGCW